MAGLQGSCDGRAKLFANEDHRDQVVFLQKKLESLQSSGVCASVSTIPALVRAPSAGHSSITRNTAPVSSFNPSLNLSFFTTTYSHLVTQRPIYLKMYSLTAKEWRNRKYLLLMLLFTMLWLMLILLFSHPLPSSLEADRGSCLLPVYPVLTASLWGCRPRSGLLRFTTPWLPLVAWCPGVMAIAQTGHSDRSWGLPGLHQVYSSTELPG